MGFQVGDIVYIGIWPHEIIRVGRYEIGVKDICTGSEKNSTIGGQVAFHVDDKFTDKESKKYNLPKAMRRAKEILLSRGLEWGSEIKRCGGSKGLNVIRSQRAIAGYRRSKSRVDQRKRKGPKPKKPAKKSRTQQKKVVRLPIQDETAGEKEENVGGIVEEEQMIEDEEGREEEADDEYDIEAPAPESEANGFPIEVVVENAPEVWNEDIQDKEQEEMEEDEFLEEMKEQPEAPGNNSFSGAFGAFKKWIPSFKFF